MFYLLNLVTLLSHYWVHVRYYYCFEIYLNTMANQISLGAQEFFWSQRIWIYIHTLSLWVFNPHTSLLIIHSLRLKSNISSVWTFVSLMEYKAPNHVCKPNYSPPPRRGQIKSKIFKCMMKSAAGLLWESNTGGNGETSTCTTPLQTPNSISPHHYTDTWRILNTSLHLHFVQIFTSIFFLFFELQLRSWSRGGYVTCSNMRLITLFCFKYFVLFINKILFLASFFTWMMPLHIWWYIDTHDMVILLTVLC